MSCCHDTAFTVDASRVTFGRGCLREVGDRARALGMTRVALFSDPTVAGLEVFDTVTLVDRTMVHHISHMADRDHM